MNQRQPALTARDVIRALVRAGFKESRTSGSHCRLVHATDPARKLTVSVHSGDLKRGTLRAIVAQAGLTVEEFIELLYRSVWTLVCHGRAFPGHLAEGGTVLA
jgi:predicted RNA binding protein YcfA (HicA-like mRNA interferase family)